MEIIKRTKEDLFGRENIHARIFSDNATPSRADLKIKLGAQLKVSPSLVQVRKITQRFGNGSVDCDVYVYNDEANLRKIEYDKYINKNFPKEKTEEGEKKEASKEGAKE